MHEYTLFFLGFSKFFMVTSVQNRNTMTHTKNNLNIPPMAEFKEFEPRFKSAKTRFKLNAGLNLETFDTILSGTNNI